MISYINYTGQKFEFPTCRDSAGQHIKLFSNSMKFHTILYNIIAPGNLQEISGNAMFWKAEQYVENLLFGPGQYVLFYYYIVHVLYSVLHDTKLILIQSLPMESQAYLWLDSCNLLIAICNTLHQVQMTLSQKLQDLSRTIYTYSPSCMHTQP